MSAKACFAVKLSRYESRLSPSIRRRPRLLQGQVTTTLEINSASISLYVIALLKGISSTCNQRRRPLLLISGNNCERHDAFNKAKSNFLSGWPEKGSLWAAMIHRVPMCALRFARNSLSGWKLASSEYFQLFSPKFFRDRRYLPQAISLNARTIHSKLPTVGKNRNHMGVKRKTRASLGAQKALM